MKFLIARYGLGGWGLGEKKCKIFRHDPLFSEDSIHQLFLVSFNCSQTLLIHLYLLINNNILRQELCSNRVFLFYFCNELFYFQPCVFFKLLNDGYFGKIDRLLSMVRCSKQYAAIESTDLVGRYSFSVICAKLLYRSSAHIPEKILLKQFQVSHHGVKAAIKTRKKKQNGGYRYFSLRS